MPVDLSKIDLPENPSETKASSPASALRSIEEMQETIERQMAPLLDVIRSFEEPSVLAALEKSRWELQEIAHSLYGPINDLRENFDLLNPAADTLGILGMVEAAKAIEDQFRLPRIEETSFLLNMYANQGISSSAIDSLILSGEVERAMASMTTPWLNDFNRLDSIEGFVGLQEIGATLRVSSPFEDSTCEFLRSKLGDWREPLNWPDELFADPSTRVAFYEETGFDTSLTDFPSAAFEEGMVVSGIAEPPPTMIEGYRSSDEGEPREAAFRRTNEAHDRIQRFETHLRSFIDQEMTLAFGSDWTKHQVPEPIRRSWTEKRNKAVREGRGAPPLITYADFTDYEIVIIRNDNWNRVFKECFRRKTSVQESFLRLYPIRVDVMHSRGITQDDELFLNVETRRILKAIEETEPVEGEIE